MSLIVSPQAPASNPTTSLQAALKLFENELTKEQKQSFLQSNRTFTPSDVVVFIAELDANNQSTRRSVSSRLFKFLDAAQQFVDVVDTFISSHPNVAALVWGGIKASLVIANNSLPYFDKVTTMITDIGKLSPTYGEFGKLYRNDRQVQTKLCDYYAVIVRICTAIVRLYSRSGFASWLLSSFEAQFKPLLDDLDKEQKRLTVCLHLASQRLISESAQNIEKEKKANSLYRQVAARFQSSSLQEQAHVRATLADQYRRQILDNLSTIKTREIWSIVHGPRVSGTAEWFTQDAIFESWCQSPHTSTLWCSGNMGVGKSVLVSSMITHIESTYHTNTSISYHFCRTGHKDTLTARGILGNITRQLLTRSISQLEDERLKTLLEQSRDMAVEDFANVLKLHLEPSPGRSYFIILDGIDECLESDIGKVLSQLKRLIEESRFHIKLLYSSRPSLEKTVNRFWKHDAKLVLGKENTQRDIEKFIELTLEQCIAEERLQVAEGLRLKIVDVLKDNHGGMFLWVALFIEELCDLNKPADIEDALDQPPKGMKELYSQKLVRIRSHKLSKDCLDVLRFTGVARQPLKIEEMREALSVELGQREFDATKLPNDMNRIVRACSGLIHVDEGTELLLYVHSSLNQYLFHEYGDPVEGFDVVEVDLRFSSICLTYLNYKNFSRQMISAPKKGPQFDPVDIARAQFASSKDLGSKLVGKLFQSRRLETSVNLQPLYDILRRDSSSRILNFNFFEYASRNWPQQIRNPAPIENSSFWHMLHQCIENQALDEWTPWLCSGVREGSVNQWSSAETMVTWALSNENNALLYHQIIYGISALRDVTKQRVLERAFGQNSDLAIAAVRRHFVTATDMNTHTLTLFRHFIAQTNAGELKFLLAAVADFKALGKYSLHEASQIGHLEVVQVLLAAGAGAGVDVVNLYKSTPLHCASQNGHLEVVEVLLAAGAGVDVGDEDQWTSLHLASMHGHLEVVKVLLAAGAGVDVVNDYKSTPLHCASGYGHLEVVKVLFAAGAGVDVVDKDKQTPLHYASEKGHFEVVEGLLTAGASVDVVNDYKLTPLHYASMTGHLEVVKVLVTAGASVDVVDTSGWTPLHIASQDGHLEVVKVLIAAGADVDAVNGNKEKAYRLAGIGGHRDIQRILQQHQGIK